MRRRAGDFARGLVAFRTLWRGRLALGLTLLLWLMLLLWQSPGRWCHRDLLLLLTLLLHGGWQLLKLLGKWRHRKLLRRQRLLPPESSLLLAGSRLLSLGFRIRRLSEGLLLLLLLLLRLRSCRWRLQHPGV